MDKQTVIDMIKPAFNLKEDNREVADKIIACYPVEYNMRVYTQQSAFTIHNTKKKLTNIDNPNLLTKLIIPFEYKKNILEELRICGITLRNIYPDVEHIAQELKDAFK